jgi:uncharacterized membrane protein YbhN (UPF0104 family)
MFSPNQGSRFKLSFGNRFLSLPTLIFLVVAGAFLYFLVVHFDANPQEIWANLKNSNPWLILLAFLLHYTTFIFRGARWRLLLNNVQSSDTPPPRVDYCGSLILVSWFVNSITAFRIGDAYRALLYSSETGNGFSQTAGTVMAERIVDVFLMFILLVLAALLLLATGIDTPWLFLALASILPVALIAALVAMRFLRIRAIRFLPKPLAEAYQQFHKGALGSFSHLPLIALFGALGWFAEVARLFFVAEALGFSIGLPMAIFATLANALLTLLPLGGLGVTEFGIASLLTRSLTRSAAGSVIVLDRAISYVSIILLGGALFLVRNLVLRRRAAHGSVVIN